MCDIECGVYVYFFESYVCSSLCVYPLSGCVGCCMLLFCVICFVSLMYQYIFWECKYTVITGVWYVVIYSLGVIIMYMV